MGWGSGGGPCPNLCEENMLSESSPKVYSSKEERATLTQDRMKRGSRLSSTTTIVTCSPSCCIFRLYHNYDITIDVGKTFYKYKFIFNIHFHLNFIQYQHLINSVALSSQNQLRDLICNILYNNNVQSKLMFMSRIQPRPPLTDKPKTTRRSLISSVFTWSLFLTSTEKEQRRYSIIQSNGPSQPSHPYSTVHPWPKEEVELSA